MDKKKFMRLAVAGMIVGRAVPIVAGPTDIASEVDAALQEAKSEQHLTVQDAEALEDASVDLY